MKTPEVSWQKISIHIIGPLSKSNNKDVIVVIVDWFTEMIRLKTTTITVLSENIAKIYRDEIWNIYGVPQKILSDRKPQFVSWFMKDLSKVLETRRTLSTVYYLQTDNQI